MKIYFSLIMLLTCNLISAQMQVNGNILYGNEWIDYNRSYLKIVINEDGPYKLTYDDLVQQGMPANFSGADLKLENEGKEVVIMTTRDGQWSSGDFLIFYGEKNDGGLDKHHYEDWETEQLNPKVSIYSDGRSYFLSIESGVTHERFEEYTYELSNPPAPQAYYIEKEEDIFFDTHNHVPIPTNSEAYFSSFSRTEGFGSRMKNAYELSYGVTRLVETPEEAPKFKVRLGTAVQAEHIINISSNGEVLLEETFSGNKIKDYTIELPYDQINSTTTFSLEGLVSESDLFSLAYASLEYPREFRIGFRSDFAYDVAPNKDDLYYEIMYFDFGTENYVFDMTNKRWATPLLDNMLTKFRFDNSGVDGATFRLFSDKAMKAPASMELVQMRSFDGMNADYLIITSEVLNSDDGLGNPIQAYADYRASAQGGGYSVAVVNIEDIMNVFGYGIEMNALAIRNFAQYIKPIWTDLEYVFFIGKALDYSNKYKNTEIESIVPTFGRPGSDNLIFSDEGKAYPYLALGRLAAQTHQEVRDYLNKAQIHAESRDVENRTIEERIWQKNVIHLSGGDVRIRDQIFAHLSNMASILEGEQFGADVRTFQKTSTDPVQTAVSAQILDIINEGSSLLTFFGHSSANTFDFSVEDPNIYENQGKWPLILSMGCNSGDIHANTRSLSEDMVLTSEKGAIAFLASSGPAFPTPLSRLGVDLYTKLGIDMYGEPIGKIINSMSRNLFDDTDARISSLHQQNTLHGDPALRLFYADGPDYVVDFPSIETANDIGTQQETFDISFDIVNLGKAQSDSLTNMLVHTYGQNQSDTILFRTIAPNNRVAVNLTLNNPGSVAIGKNIINIILDINDDVDESPDPLAESNNDLKVAYNNPGYCFFIFDNSAFPIYPKDFAIVNNLDISLKASSTNAFGEKEFYLLEIDTTELFDSPLLEKTEVFASPALIEWNPELPFEHEQVYYWRIKPKDADNTIWNTSSFVYLENSSEGWNQSHLYQWQKDSYNNFKYEADTRKFNFVDNINEVKIENVAHLNDVITPFLTVSNEGYFFLPYNGEINAGVYFAIIDPNTGLPWKNQPDPVEAQFGSTMVQDWALNWPIFPYSTQDEAGRAKAINFIENEVPDGHIVICYTIQRQQTGEFKKWRTYQINEWEGDAAVHPEGKDLLTVLENQGATRIRELIDNERPYIFVFKKNDLSYPERREILSDAETKLIEYKFNVKGLWPEGEVQSTIIGPALEWNKLIWDLESIDLFEDDTRLDLYGIDVNGKDSLLVSDVKEFEFDLTDVRSEEFPYLKLNYYTFDEESRTPAQLGYWRVLYKEKPEAVLNIAEKFNFESDSLLLGESLRLSTVAQNISASPMDSLLVRYTIVDDNNTNITTYETLPPLGIGETLDIDFEYPTDDLLGLNQFIVEINPGEAQPEQFLFNNIGKLDFSVGGDRINPILDLTFDGQRIMDGDIVSPTPRIRVDLKDENKFLFVDDIKYFNLALQHLPDPQSYPVDLASDNIIFTPADSVRGNHATLEFLPELEGGEYILYVQAKDASGNLSGDQSIDVQFEVIEDSQVSHVLNYPNPFSTSTQFIFTLTGYEVPEVFTIQIMTVSGKVVREITKDELGPLRIGTNRTNFRWDGTDAFGSPLANGVYLYRVMTSHNNEAFNHYQNESIDDYFKKGFGKLVIMR